MPWRVWSELLDPLASPLGASHETGFTYSYHQAHLPLHEQDAILGHSVRALYLTTAAADLGGDFLDDAKRLFDDATKRKMYVTGGLGTEPRVSSASLPCINFPVS